jgi:ADP-ribose pyrophosphatase YjhB (NUDIX family)
MRNQKLIIASGPVIVKENKVLLNQHGDTEFWKFCGGSTQDFNHRLTDIAKNKALDEMGLKIKILEQAPFIQYILKDSEHGPVDVILVHFLAESIGEIKPRKDIRAWDWLPLENLNKENLAPNIIPTLKHFGFIK